MPFTSYGDNLTTKYIHNRYRIHFICLVPMIAKLIHPRIDIQVGEKFPHCVIYLFILACRDQSQCPLLINGSGFHTRS